MPWCFRYRLFGCYEALSGGELSEALEDFTGGVSETKDLKNEPLLANEDDRDKFYDWLVSTIDNNGVMCAAISVSNNYWQCFVTDRISESGNAIALSICLTFCLLVDHDHGSQGIIGQGHRSRSWVRLMRSAWPRLKAVCFLVDIMKTLELPSFVLTYDRDLQSQVSYGREA